MEKEIEIHKETYLSRRHIGRFLKNVRKKKKLTLYAVAKLSGISIGQLQSVEKAKAAYTAETLIKITNALGIEVLFKDGENSEQVNPIEAESICEHPWASVMGDGEMKPAKCLKCGQYL